jgi:hypothetical protein
MITRRLIGLLVAVLMAHLTFVGADFSCAQHGDRGMISHHEAAPSHAAMAMRTTAAAATDQPCQTPTQPECCRAMTSCTISAALGTPDASSERPLSRDVIASALMRIPRSPITAPDPPPPKA